MGHGKEVKTYNIRIVDKGGEEHVEVRVCEGVVDVRNVEFNGTKD